MFMRLCSLAERTRAVSACTSWYSKQDFTLHCPDGEKIKVIRAFYGYWSWGDDHKKCGYASGDCTTDAATPGNDASCWGHHFYIILFIYTNLLTLFDMMPTACFSNDCVVTAERSSVSFSCGKWNDYMQVEYKCVVWRSLGHTVRKRHIWAAKWRWNLMIWLQSLLIDWMV